MQWHAIKEGSRGSPVPLAGVRAIHIGGVDKTVVMHAQLVETQLQVVRGHQRSRGVEAAGEAHVVVLAVNLDGVARDLLGAAVWRAIVLG